MCRLFAQISRSPRNAKDVLVDSCFSLLKQSNFNKNNLQKDGWGVAYFNGHGRPVIRKSPGAIYKESKTFARAASAARSRLVLGHIRAASNPRGLPFARMISPANTQPFTDGRWAFAHNGTLEIPVEISRRLGPLRKKLRGLNDSEVYFWQFIKFYRVLGDVAAAFQACVREDWAAWKACRKRYPNKRGPFTSLNAVLTDGRKLYAFNHFIKRKTAGRALCSARRPWSVMSFRRRGGRLIVASEDLDRGSWGRMRPPELLSAEAGAGRLMVARRPLQLETR